MYPKTNKLLRHTLAAGALGFALRLVLYRVGFDDKNILSAAHPLHLVCLTLTAGMAVYLALALRGLKGSGDPAANFPASPLRSLLMLLAAAFTAFHALTVAREGAATMNLIRTALSFTAAIGMGLCALTPQRFSGLSTACRGIVCVFFAAEMLCRYQSWSGNPQLSDYTFQVFACALLALLSYQRLAFDTGLGKRRSLLWCCLMGLFLCLVCAAGPETRIFYLGGGGWAASCLCSILPPAEVPQEEAPDVPA